MTTELAPLDNIARLSPTLPDSPASNFDVVRFTSGVTTAALLAIHASVALAQAPGTLGQEPQPTEPPPKLTLFDKQTLRTTPPRSAFESLFGDADVTCIGCPGSETIFGPPATNRNAPWVLRGRWQRETRFGVASLGFAGIRNSSLPASTLLPLGGDVSHIATSSSHTGFFMPSTQWSVTAGLEKTVKKFSNGASIGVLADGIVPLATTSTVGGDPRLGGMKSTALRIGIVVRW